MTVAIGTTLAAIAEVSKQPSDWERAIESFKAALQIFNSRETPDEWADTEFQLGLAYASLWELTEKSEYSQLSIKSYQAALNVYKIESTPNEWALASYNLAVNFFNLGSNKELLKAKVICISLLEFFKLNTVEIDDINQRDVIQLSAEIEDAL